MKIKISYPNDYNSAERYAEADRFFGGDGNSIEEMGAELGSLVVSLGGKFVEETDFGAVWEFAAMPELPAWAEVEIL